MSDLHIDDFYRDTAKILVWLYGQFPKAGTLYVEDIAGQDMPDEFGLHSNRHERCLHAILWLGLSGYLHYQQLVKQEAVDQAVLSHHAFVSLTTGIGETESGPLPQAKTHIEAIRSALKQGSSNAIETAVREFLLMRRATTQ